VLSDKASHIWARARDPRGMGGRGQTTRRQLRDVHPDARVMGTSPWVTGPVRYVQHSLVAAAVD
jgi:hypothetical protein